MSMSDAKTTTVPIKIDKANTHNDTNITYNKVVAAIGSSGLIGVQVCHWNIQSNWRVLLFTLVTMGLTITAGSIAMLESTGRHLLVRSHPTAITSSLFRVDTNTITPHASLFVSSSAVPLHLYNPRSSNLKTRNYFIMKKNSNNDDEPIHISMCGTRGGVCNREYRSSLWLSTQWRGGMQQFRSNSTSTNSGRKKAGGGRSSNNNKVQNGKLTPDSLSVLEKNDGVELVDQTSLSSSSLSTSSKTSRRSRFGRAIGQGLGNLLSGVGFVSSTVVSLATDRQTFQTRFGEPIKALRMFLKTSGVDIELLAGLNRRLGINMCLLGRVHMDLDDDTKDQHHHHQQQHGANSMTSLVSSSSSGAPAISGAFWEEGRRYMRYATAVYGQSMIRAAELDARGHVDVKMGRLTKEVIGHHISIPPDDIVLMDVDYDGDSSHLRHFVAVDHMQKKVVLSIRGTFNLAEIVLDVAGFTKEFCGGEAHSEMATMAERVWNVAGPTVCKALGDNKDYEFIITGHSLGAGAACLLTILLEAKDLLPRKQKYRCFAYAPPPVYTPLEFIPKAVKATTSFVHENDAVPYLSVHTVRHLLSDLRAVDDEAHNRMTSSERYKVVLGIVPPPKDLIAAVLESEGKSLPPKQGAPKLYIPAEKIVWLREDNEILHGVYRYDILSPKLMAKRGIRVNPDMLLDHFPPRYEHALDHIEDRLH
jgi:hypothetical protein